MIGHRVTSPLLFGIRDGGGLGSNTDEMATAMDLLERNVLQGYREAVCDALSEVLEVPIVPASTQAADEAVADPKAMDAQAALKRIGRRRVRHHRPGGPGRRRNHPGKALPWWC